MPRAGQPPKDDDGTYEWAPAATPNTDVDLDPSDLLELEADAITPARDPSTLPGYELGRRDERLAFFSGLDNLFAEERRQGAVAVLLDLRDELVRQWNDQEFVDEFVRRMAARRGITLG